MVYDETTNEGARLEALRALDVLDTPSETAVDAIVSGAQLLFRCKSAFVSLVDVDRQWFMSACGLDLSETPRSISFCTHTVAANDIQVIRDTHLDARFVDNPLVVGEPFVRFYAGVPLRAAAPGGGPRYPIGTLCVIDDRPRAPSAQTLKALVGMAQVVEALLEARRTSRQNLQLAFDRQDALEEMARTHKVLQHAERMARIGSWRLDLESGIVRWSDQTYAIHGLEPGTEEHLADAMLFYPEEDRAKLKAALDDCTRSGTAWDLELNFTDVQGQSRRVRTLGEVDLRDGRPVALMGVIQDITDRYQFERRLVAVARTDELTGIPSRRAFNEEIEQLLERASGSPAITVAIIDLDRFKEVNDQLGHAAGDEVLRAMAGKLKAADYLGDHFFARLGGDEFVVVLRGERETAEIEQAIGRLLADLHHSVPAPKGTIEVTATIGVSSYGARHVDRSSLLQEADEALYRAKRMARGSGVIAGASGLVERPGLPPKASTIPN
ncbi:MAG: diguanylate cyclase [Sphingomonas paucimobilis]